MAKKKAVKRTDKRQRRQPPARDTAKLEVRTPGVEMSVNLPKEGVKLIVNTGGGKAIGTFLITPDGMAFRKAMSKRPMTDLMPFKVLEELRKFSIFAG